MNRLHLFALAACSLVAFCWAATTAQPPATATATYSGSSPPLVVNGDNEPILRPWFDSLPDGCTVNLPAGDWHVGRPLICMKRLAIQGAGKDQTTIRGDWADATGGALVVGNYGAGQKVNGVTLRALTIAQSASGTGIHNALVVTGDDFTAEDCRFQGSEHEGAVVAASCLRAIFTRCEAVNCGRGGVSYNLSTAGFNAHAAPTIYTDCAAHGCGQGFEIDGHGSKAIRCVVDLPPANVSPQIAFNVGSAGLGISDVELDHCTSLGYGDAVAASNGIGRFASLNVHDCTFDAGAVTVAGGKRENSANDPDIPAGPDTGQSHVDHCVFVVRGPLPGILGYNGGPSAGGPEISREPYTFNDNVFYFVGPVDDSTPIIYAAGAVQHLTVSRNTFLGLNAAPSRGDFQSFTLQDNPAPPGQPGIAIDGLRAFKADGTMRPAVVRREGSAP
jgi:hypothetical protein